MSFEDGVLESDALFLFRHPREPCLFASGSVLLDRSFLHRLVDCGVGLREVLFCLFPLLSRSEFLDLFHAFSQHLFGAVVDGALSV